MNRGIASGLSELSARFRSAAWHQPLGLPGHREKLREAALNGLQHYGDTFSYPRADIAGYRVALLALSRQAEQIDRPLLQELVLSHLQQLETDAGLAENRCDETYSAAQQLRPGVPSAGLITRARQILASVDQPADRPATLSAHDIAEKMRAVLHTYDLDDWSVQVTPDMAAKASVNGSLRRIRLRAGTSYTEREAHRLVAHEIGGHVLRWSNAHRQIEALAAVPFANTTITEEGMALWVEHDLDLGVPGQSRLYALRSIAVDLALRHGIMPLIERLRSWAGLDTCVELALRVKRGLVDPNAPGGATKDFGYLEGFYAISALSPYDRAVLAGVKWGLSHLGTAKTLAADGALQLPRLLPTPVLLGIHQSV